MSIDPPRNFTITTEERVRALSIDVPAWAARKRQLEDMEDKLLADMIALHDKKGREVMVAAVRRLDFAKMNAIVERHNRWYPIEANLPTDPETLWYVQNGRPWGREERWTAERAVAKVDEALAARAEALR